MYACNQLHITCLLPFQILYEKHGDNTTQLLPLFAEKDHFTKRQTALNILLLLMYMSYITFLLAFLNGSHAGEGKGPPRRRQRSSQEKAKVLPGYQVSLLTT